MKFRIRRQIQIKQNYIRKRLPHITLSAVMRRKHALANMSLWGLVLSIGLGCMLSVSASSVYAEDKSARTDAGGTDVRLLIDISGSMKKNDPSNLRIPAVNLLTELIPDGDKAGVWTFGQWVNNLIQHKVVNGQWRADAKDKAKKINSVALFTNIGAVLEKAADDFYKQDKDFSNTHFILLTDGMVDIDKDPEKNANERDRILTTLLKSFKDKGAKIHTVSLSNNADKALMEKLAVQTGGQSAIAESPEELASVFLQALEQAVPSEQVPLEGNEFVIDSSIEEFTALIFRGDQGSPTELMSPDEKIYSYRNQGEDIKWYQDEGYDLITVNRPLEGTWEIKADVLPDSRVTVVSNLQLNVTKLPVNFFAGDPLNVEVSFSEDGKQVQSPEFLSLLDIDLQLTTESNMTASKSMSEGGVPADGVFKESIRKLSKIGQYEVSVLVDGKTFKRKNRQVINLRAPFDFEMAVRGEGDLAYYELVVTPMNDTISAEETNIFAKVNAPDNSSLISALELDEKNQRWTLPVRRDKGDGIYQISVKVKAKTTDEKSFKFKPQPFEAEFPIPAGVSNQVISNNEPEEPQEELPEDVLPNAEEDAPIEEPVSEPVVETEVETEVEKEVEVAADPKVEDAVEEPEASDEKVDLVEEDNLALYLIIGGGVLAGLLVGGVIVYLIRKRKSIIEEDDEVLSDEDIDEISEELEESVSDEASDELDFVEEPPEDIPVLDDPSEDSTPDTVVLEEEQVEIDDVVEAPEVVVEEPVVEEPVVEESAVEELVVEDEAPEVVETIDQVLDELDELDEPLVDIEEDDVQEQVADVLDEPQDEAVDLSSEDLSDVVEELTQEEEREAAEESLDVSDEEDLAADIAQAIEDAAEEPEDELDKEIEQALDINDMDDDDDDDEEFNLEDFDIGDTDELPEEDKK